MSRTLLGFLIAPLVIAVGMLPTEGLEHLPLQDQVLDAAFGFLIWYMYPLFFATIFALPLFLLLKRFGLVRWWVALITGVLIGVVGAMSINGQPQLFYGKLVILSGISGLLFWFIVASNPRAAESLGQD